MINTFFLSPNPQEKWSIFMYKQNTENVKEANGL